MTVYERDIIRLHSTETGLQLLMRNGMDGYATDTFKKIHVFPSGVTRKWTPDEERVTNAEDVVYKNHPVYSNLQTAMDYLQYTGTLAGLTGAQDGDIAVFSGSWWSLTGISSVAVVSATKDAVIIGQGSGVTGINISYSQPDGTTDRLASGNNKSLQMQGDVVSLRSNAGNVLSAGETGVGIFKAQAANAALDVSGAGFFSLEDEKTYEVSYLMTLEHTSTGGVTGAFGTGVLFKAEDQYSATESIASIVATTTPYAENTTLKIYCNDTNPLDSQPATFSKTGLTLEESSTGSNTQLIINSAVNSDADLIFRNNGTQVQKLFYDYSLSEFICTDNIKFGGNVGIGRSAHATRPLSIQAPSNNLDIINAYSVLSSAQGAAGYTDAVVEVDIGGSTYYLIAFEAYSTS